jgi:nitrogen regulatory protein PII-like uncharacterized protein
MIWGLEKASSSKLKEYEGQNNNPKSTIKKKIDKSEKQSKEKKVEKRFDPSEDYGITDLPFLKKEASRIDKEIEKDIDYDENLDLQDKIYELIETLEEMNEKFGSGLRPPLSESNLHKNDFDESSSDEESEDDRSKPLKGKGVETISKAKNKKVSESKVRVEKGSEKAKEIGQKLAEARKKKREETGKLTVKEQADKKREDKAKLRNEKAKPWYYVGIIPKGYREASEDEAIKNNKVGSYGKHVVDMLKYEFFDKYNILLSHDLSDSEVQMSLLGIPKKIKKSFYEIEVLESKLENNKYSESQYHSYDNKLADERHTNKNLIKAFNWIYKLFCQRKGKPYVKKIFTPPEKEEVVYSKSETVFIPTKKETIDPRILKIPSEMKKEIKKQTHDFENAFHKISIPHKAFTDLKLTPKYAKKLYDKNILLLPEHYQLEDVKKYFYDKHGTGIGSKDAQKLISLGYKPEMNDIGEYTLDRDLSIDKARVYKNNKTGRAYIVHRGTKEAYDWLNNLVYALSPSLYKYTNRYKQGKDVQEKALEKYGHNVDVIGHSQGAKIAELASRGDKRIDDVITYNRPVGPMESLSSLDKNVTDIRSSYDPVSMLAPFQKGNKPIIMKNESWNPLSQHNSSSLLENPNQDLGNMKGEGIVKRKPPESLRLADIVQSVVFMKPYWNVTNAIKWLKEHKYYKDEIHESKTQIRFRQYNPEDLRDRHYISKRLKNENILLIISTMNNRGTGFMIENYEFLTPKEHKELEYKKFFEAQTKHQKANEKLEKENKVRMKTIKKAIVSRVKKGSQEAKDKMAKVRAGKGL